MWGFFCSDSQVGTFPDRPAGQSGLLRMVWYCALEIPAGMAIRREEHLKRILFSYGLTQKPQGVD